MLTIHEFIGKVHTHDDQSTEFCSIQRNYEEFEDVVFVFTSYELVILQNLLGNYEYITLIELH